MSPRQIVDGFAKGSVPPRYEGGIGAAGTRELEAFVRGGGTLVTLNGSSHFAMDEFHLPVRDVVRDLPRDEYFAEGAIVELLVDPSHPVMSGMSERSKVFPNEHFGFRRITEMIGRTDVLEPTKAIDHWKASGLDLTPMLEPAPKPHENVDVYCTREQDHGLNLALDNRLITLAKASLADSNQRTEVELPIVNTNRTVGTMLSHTVVKKWGEKALPDDVDAETRMGWEVVVAVYQSGQGTVYVDTNPSNNSTEVGQDLAAFGVVGRGPGSAGGFIDASPGLLQQGLEIVVLKPADQFLAGLAQRQVEELRVARRRAGRPRTPPPSAPGPGCRWEHPQYGSPRGAGVA